MEGIDIKKEQTNQTVQASIAGVGSGTLLLLLAQNLPDTHPYKTWLIIIAPSLTIAILFIWKFISLRLDLYLKSKKVQQLMTKLRYDISQAIQNPHFPKSQIEDLKERLAKLELMNVDRLIKDIEEIDIDYKKM